MVQMSFKITAGQRAFYRYQASLPSSRDGGAVRLDLSSPGLRGKIPTGKREARGKAARKAPAGAAKLGGDFEARPSGLKGRERSLFDLDSWGR